MAVRAWAARLGASLRMQARASGSSAPAAAASGDAATQDYVPIIDLARLRGGNAEHKREVALEIRRACEQVGFFVITSHGVPQSVIDSAWAASKDFFDMPTSVKAGVKMDDSYPYGYSGFKEEVLSKGKDFEEGREVPTPPDLKESFSLGPYDPRSGMPAPRWPTGPAHFEPAITAYYQEMEKLAGLLLEAFALALELPQDWFEDKMDGHCSALRVLNYPDLDRPPEEGQLRASAHTDYGILTILRQDDAPGGLEVLKLSGEWYKVPRVPDSYVINLGDLMARWTNDRWRSTSHRVVCPPPDRYGSSRRQSMAFFANIKPSSVVSCIETCVSTENPAKYPPINAMQFLLEKHAAATGGKAPSQQTDHRGRA